MAEVTGLRNNALNYPVYGVPWGVVFPILDADGDLVTGATGLDSERSLNADTFADCTNEATEIATSSGTYYLLLTAAEMTADVVVVIVKTSTSGAKTTTLTFYPRKLIIFRAATAAGGAAGSITLDSSANATDDYYNGCLVVGVLDTLTEARIITDYTGSSKVAAVTPNWNTTPDSDDTFTIYLPEGRQIQQADVSHWKAVGVQGSTGRPECDVTRWAGGTVPAPATTGVPSVDAIAISGDTAAADNAESYFDGTGYGAILQRTTIATLASQTSFTLTAGSADDSAYAGCRVVIQDATTAAQKATGLISAYTGATKTVTLAADPAIFTMATTDIVTILAPIDVTKWAGAGVAALITGRVDVSVGELQANVLTAAATAGDFTTEIQAGLATAAALTVVDDFLDTEVLAIKAKTDSLTFTSAGLVDANIQQVNDVPVVGTGAPGDEWGPS